MYRPIYRLLLLAVVFVTTVLQLPAQGIAQQKKVQKPVNPLERIVNQIFGKKPKKVEQDALEEAPEDGRSTYKKDAVDQRAPLVREQQSLLYSARTRIKLKQYPEALEVLQKILDLTEESIIQESDGQYRSIHWVSQQEIAKLPSQAQQYYKKTYGPLAQRMLDDAYGQSDFSGIRNVARRYFHTQAGYEAANHIASYHLDQGEFAVASQWYKRLDSTTAQFVSDPLWKLKVGEVYRQCALGENESAPLTENQQKELQRRLPGHSIEEFRKQWHKLSLAFNPPLTNWLFPGGSARRSAPVEGTAPLLLSDWQHKMAENSQIVRQINQLVEDLKISNIPAIPMMQPITIGDRVVIRTLDGLKAIDAQSGTVLWESREKVSPAMLLAGVPATSQNSSNFGINFQIRRGIVGNANGAFINRYPGGQAEQRPVTNLLMRNSVHGTLSSEGKHVFVIERNAVLSRTQPGQYYSNFSLSRNDAYHRDWSSNRLTAYDLETGKLAWHIGGPSLNEPIDPPLAGTFFFGPPLTDNGELFVIGERENALRVYCLQPENGKVLWSQLLAYTDAPIDRDLARRWGATQLAFSEGVLVCPTHVGLLVGIDRQSHEILWMSRYTKKQKTPSSQPIRQRGGGFVISHPGSLKSRWFATPPMICGQTIIYAPLEEPTLIGFRLADGKQRWKSTGLEQGLYPVGCYGTDIIVASEDALTGYDVNLGNETWTVPFSVFDSSDRTTRSIPCGRGLIAGHQIMLPMDQQEIWYFDLDQKKFTSRAHVADSDLRLGNLVMARGKLISAGPDTVAMFQPKMIVEQKITTRLKENPQDAWALLKKAQVLAMEQQFQAGLAALTKIDTSSLEDSQQTPFRRQMLECLIGTVKEQPLKFEQQFQQIPTYIETDHEHQVYLRLQADRMLARKDYASAFEAYSQLAKYRGKNLTHDVHDASLSSRQDVWLNTQLKELWGNSSGEVSSQIIQTVQKSIESAMDSNDIQHMLHVVRVYEFHPEIEAIYFCMVELAIEQKDFSTAEFALKMMAKLKDESVVATANTRRAELLHQFGLNSDAMFYLEVLEKQDPELVLLDGLTLGEWLEEKKQEKWPSSTLENISGQSWGNEEFEFVQISTSGSRSQTGQVNLSKSDLPFYKEHRFLFNNITNRLEIYRLRDDRLTWSLPLLQNNGSSAGKVLPVRVDGHLLTVYYRGIIQCYSLPDQRLVWSRPIASQATGYQVINATSKKITRLQTAQYAAARISINKQDTQFGPLAISTSDALCYFSRHELIAVDPLDGEIRWVRRGIPRGTAVYGDDKYLLILPPNISDALVVNTSDGRIVESGEISSLVSDGIAVSGHHIIAVNTSSSSLLGIRSGSVVISAVDLITRDKLWEHYTAKDDYIGLLDAESLIIIKKQGTVNIVNLNDGQVKLEGEIQEDAFDRVREIYAVGSKDQVFVILNGSTGQPTYLNNIQNQRVSGNLVAIDRQSGKQMWMQAVKSLNLVLQDIDQMPVLIFGAMKYQRLHNLYFNKFRMLVLDKQTGKTLIEKSLATQQQVSRINWSISKKTIRMHASNICYMIRPKRNVAQNSTK
ncbi:MAG: PQQ-binding-like beta-propeller repeat protein [Planctomycetaceae bacterium]|nr:PQQ-binding-like beta-propeller repeat protein [Planctomycetaceae bacterium]